MAMSPPCLLQRRSYRAGARAPLQPGTVVTIATGILLARTCGQVQLMESPLQTGCCCKGLNDGLAKAASLPGQRSLTMAPCKTGRPTARSSPIAALLLEMGAIQGSSEHSISESSTILPCAHERTCFLLCWRAARCQTSSPIHEQQHKVQKQRPCPRKLARHPSHSTLVVNMELLRKIPHLCSPLPAGCSLLPEPPP